MQTLLHGRARRFGDDITTDAISPSKYSTMYLPPEEMATHAMEGADPEFSTRVKPGDLVVGGKNFGCGSSREEAVIALAATKICCVVAESFGRIFYRNAINRGLLVMECPGLGDQVVEGDDLELRPREGILRNLTKGVDLKVYPLTATAAAILDAGGLLPYVKSKISGKEA
jgi:3-isopropylmalate/(R)-2-methylmalate dehydratase small subunit